MHFRPKTGLGPANREGFLKIIFDISECFFFISVEFLASIFNLFWNRNSIFCLAFIAEMLPIHCKTPNNPLIVLNSYSISKCIVV